MTIFQYDEVSNVARLGGFPRRLQALFAVLAALRILPMYGRFHAKTGRGDPRAVQALTDRLWRDLNGEPMTDDEAQRAAERALSLVPSEDDGWDEDTQAYAEDAAAALAYALRARVTGDPQEAAWAARRVYEAADHFAGATSEASLGAHQNERVILAHPVVQAELARQQRDLRDLAELMTSGMNDSQILRMWRRSEQEADIFFRPVT